MDFLSPEIILSPLGWIYLRLKYCDREKIQNVLVNKFNSHYCDAGTYVALKTFTIILLTLIASLIVAAIISIFRFGIS